MEISSWMAPLALDSWQIYLMARFRRKIMSRNLLLSAVAFALMLCWTTVPLLAHHSFAAEFDGSKPVKVTGVVKKVEWMNPHIWFYVEGQDEISGKSAVWGFSAGPPSTLTRRGIKRDVLNIGDTVKVDGFLAKD